MPDTYPQSPPTSEMLLHDLARIITEDGSGITLTRKTTNKGPRERLESAAADYALSVGFTGEEEPEGFINHLMEMEHAAWLKAVEVLRERGIEINDDNELTAALEMWGERLVKMRLNQTKEVRDAAELRRVERFSQQFHTNESGS